jgi:hypothetical protein
LGLAQAPAGISPTKEYSPGAFFFHNHYEKLKKRLFEGVYREIVSYSSSSKKSQQPD